MDEEMVCARRSVPWHGQDVWGHTDELDLKASGWAAHNHALPPAVLLEHLHALADLQKVSRWQDMRFHAPCSPHRTSHEANEAKYAS
jgi:hypothetical protein